MGNKHHGVASGSAQILPCLGCRQEFRDKKQLIPHIVSSHRQINNSTESDTKAHEQLVWTCQHCKSNLSLQDQEDHTPIISFILKDSSFNCCQLREVMSSQYNIHDAESETEDVGMDFERNLGSEPEKSGGSSLLREESWQFETTIKAEKEAEQEEEALIFEELSVYKPNESAEQETESQEDIPSDLVNVNSQSSVVQEGEGSSGVEVVEAEERIKVRKNGKASSGKTTKADKIYICSWEDCKRTFNSRQTLAYHIKTHSGLKLYQCSWSGCTKTFKHSSNEKKHRLLHTLHTQEKKFICSFAGCGKAFRWSSNEKRHQLVHTQEKKYNCTWPGCTKSFCRRFDEKRHQSTHTRVNNVQCDSPGCGKSFSEKSSLIVHQRIHTGEKPFVCPTCHKSFRDQSTFVRHKRIHTGDKPFACKICNKTFSTCSNKNRHEKHHDKKN